MADRQHTLLTPAECVVALVDHQPQMFFGVGSHIRETIVSNATALAKSAKLFKVPSTSVNQRRTNRTPRSSTVRKT